MTTDGRKVTLLGETATVPEDPRFRIWRDGIWRDGGCDFRISLGGVTHCCTLESDYFDGVLALSACEAAIVHFGIKARKKQDEWHAAGHKFGRGLECDQAIEDGATWMRILEKVRARL